MINGLIVSKNRACQLRLLLESISVNAPSLLNEVLIIYASSNEKFARGYDKLKEEKILPKSTSSCQTMFGKRKLILYQTFSTLLRPANPNTYVELLMIAFFIKRFHQPPNK